MKFVYWLATILVLFCCYGTLKGKQKDKIMGVRYTMHFPQINNKGKLEGYDTVFSLIYYYGNQVTCNFMYRYDSLENSKLVNSEWRHFYFTYAQGKKYGLIFEKGIQSFERMALVDSVLDIHWRSTRVTPEFFEINNVVQTSKKYDTDDGVLTEEFSIREKKDTTFSASLLLRFTNKSMATDFSLSKRLDSMENMKCFFYKLSIHPKYYASHKYVLDGFDLISYFEEIPVSNEAELLYYFDRDRKMNEVHKEKK